MTDDLPLPLDDHICFSIYGASLTIQRLYKPLLDDLGITYPQYLALNLLWTEDGQSVGALAARLDLEPSTMTPLLKRLEQAELVRRSRDPKNERRVLIHLTKSGAALRGKAGCLKTALLDGSEMSLAEIATLNSAVRDLRDVLRKASSGQR